MITWKSEMVRPLGLLAFSKENEMAKYEVTIKEIHDVTATVELPKDATKEEILEAAEQLHEAASDPLPTEYNRLMDKEMWTVLDLQKMSFV
jgi:hypothetical protein